VIDALKLNGGERETVFPSSRFFEGGRKTARIHIDANGNLTNDGNGKTFTYDAANRVISVTQNGTTVGYTYDGWGHRVQETSNGAIVKQWVWCGGTQPCEERDASNNVTKRFYGHGEQIGGANYYFTTDHMGSVREMTNSAGALVARYDYDPYGRRSQVLSGGTDLADFGFTGFYYDQATGLDFSRTRPYIADLGRWLGRDTVGEEGGINLYRYCGNNPINYRDPNGKWFLGALIDTVIGATAAYIGSRAQGGSVKEALENAVIGGAFGLVVGLADPFEGVGSAAFVNAAVVGGLTGLITNEAGQLITAANKPCGFQDFSLDKGSYAFSGAFGAFAGVGQLGLQGTLMLQYGLGETAADAIASSAWAGIGTAAGLDYDQSQK
jgi:RHS repeat-associated protein